MEYMPIKQFSMLKSATHKVVRLSQAKDTNPPTSVSTSILIIMLQAQALI